MTQVDGRAEFRQTLRDRAQLNIGTRHLISQAKQYLGDSAHTNAPDSHEVYVLGLKKHFSKVLFRLSSGVSMRKAALYRFLKAFSSLSRPLRVFPPRVLPRQVSQTGERDR